VIFSWTHEFYFPSSRISSTARMTPTTPEAFHLFYQLPREIRLIIWTLALPRPRIVPLFHRKIKHLIRQRCPFRYCSPKGAKTNQRHIHCTFKSALPPPVIFFVNRESSAVASKWYTRAFPCCDVGRMQWLLQ
jgi:hypothetical protein